MGIKDLFGKKSNKIVTRQQVDQLVDEVESKRYIETQVKARGKFIPKLDFSDPKYFAHYGSAEKYYEDAIRYIYKTYPYDGSLAEKNKWRYESTYLDNWLYKNEYPRTTGYLDLNTGQTIANTHSVWELANNPQYVYLQGGPNPHVDKPHGSDVPDGRVDSKSEIFSKHESRANLWNDTEEYFQLIRNSNLYISGDVGTTVEFWYKSSTDPSSTICLFDLWNQEAISASNETRLLIEYNPVVSQFQVYYKADGKGISGIVQIGTAVDPFSSAGWNHYAFTFKNVSSEVECRLYINGELNDTVLADGTPALEWIPNLTATIGAYSAAPGSTAASGGVVEGWGTHPGSFDEFRFWKVARSHKEIGRHWFTQVGGGTNEMEIDTTDKGNIDLGVYYKFNEGITEELGFDSTVLDYSGRASNGTIKNYMPAVRNLGSAMDESAVVTNSVEIKDPILYPDHPDVAALLEEKKKTGHLWDQQNNASIYHSIPSWITDDDKGELLNLTQIISSYFDQLHMQIQELPRIKDMVYDDPELQEIPYPFAKDLLLSMGFVAPDIFVEASVLEEIASRDEDRIFEKDLQVVKNLIYQNIYNNLVYIYKSKGTEKSFRNLIRCFGIDDELIKINLYADNFTYKLEDNVSYTSVRKNYVDFFRPEHNEATVYQIDEASNSNSQMYIEGSPAETQWKFVPSTFECEVIFPKMLGKDHPQYFPPVFGFPEASMVYSSIAGILPVDPSGVYDGSVNTDIELYVQRTGQDETDAKFILNNVLTGETLESPIFREVYNNEKWNFAIRIRPADKYWNDGECVMDLAGTESSNYVVEFYGVNTTLDVIENEFMVTSLEFSQTKFGDFMESNKRIYLGCQRVGFASQTVNIKSDVRISSVRFWHDYIDDKTVKYHAYDVSSFGRLRPYQPAYFSQMSFVNSSHGTHVPQIETLVLHWDFSTVTTSDAGGSIPSINNDAKFLAPDLSSGSIANAGRWGWMGDIVEKQYPAQGDYFLPNNNQVIDREYVHTAKTQLPESISSSSTVKVLQKDDELFPRSARGIEHFWAIEKSMYQTISEEMINMFASISDFNNLIGQPVNRYRMEYKALGKLREIFFQKVENTPSIDKYVDFYKWFDSSLNLMLQQLIPASANFSDSMRTVIESHVLERNKYWTKFPTLEMKDSPPEGSIRGIRELLYDWEFGHRVVGGTEAEGCEWWSERAERDVPTSGNASVDAAREQIRKAVVRDIKGQTEMIKDGDDWIETDKRFYNKNLNSGELYEGSTYAVRRLSRPYKYSVSIEEPIGGGVNYQSRKRSVGFMRSLTGFGSKDGLKVHCVRDPHRDSVSLLLSMDSVDSGGGPPDLSSYNHTINNDGANWTIESTTPTPQFGAASGDFTAAGAVLEVSSNEFVMGTDDFTIEGWFNADSAVTDSGIFELWVSPSWAGTYFHNIGFGIINNLTGGHNDFVLTANDGFSHTNVSPHCSSLSCPPPGGATSDQWSFNTWHHFAVVKHSGMTKLYLDGDEKISVADTRDYNGTDNCRIGGRFDTSREFNGYIDDFRITKGVARYKDNFPNDLPAKAFPPSVLTSVDCFSSLTTCNDDAEIRQKILQDSAVSTVLAPEGSYLNKLWGSIAAPYSEYSDHDGPVVITNRHSDQYGSANETPMQGPFTEAHVGGSQHRHIEANLDALDTRATRPELYLYDSAITTYVAPDMHSDAASVDYPRAPFFRDETSKRPVNIRNIASYDNLNKTNIFESTGSQVLGNYRFAYEVVQTSSRSHQNRYLVKNQGIELKLNPVDNAVEGLFDFRLPDRSHVHRWSQGSTFLNEWDPAAWHVTSPYSTGDIVSHENSFWKANTATSAGDEPTNVSTKWDSYNILPAPAQNNPNFGPTQHVIVERFSAPGSPDTNGRGALDPEAEEFTPYNSLNYRNYLVRWHLNQWHKEHKRQFGGLHTPGSPASPDPCLGLIPGLNSQASRDFCLASYHKVNRNPRHRSLMEEDRHLLYDPDDPAVSIGAVASETVYDNWFVQHQIPQSDWQYSWIRANTSERTIPFDSHAAPYNLHGYISDFPNLTIASKEVTGAIHRDTNTLDEFTIEPDSDSSALFGANNYAGIHTTNPSYMYAYNTALETLSSPATGLMFEVDEQENLIDDSIGASISSIDNAGKFLNALLSHRGGGYADSMWKSIRTGDNIIPRLHKKNNIISVIDRPIAPPGAVDNTTCSRYREPIAAWNMPMMTALNPVDSTQGIRLRHSYSNNIEGFANRRLINRLGDINCQEQMYHRLLEQYRHSADLGAAIHAFSAEFAALNYKEYIFPRHCFVGLKEVRERLHYFETDTELVLYPTGDLRTFWRDNSYNRRRKMESKNALGHDSYMSANQHSAYRQLDSVWGMDDYTFVPQDAPYDDSGRLNTWQVLGDLAYVGPERYHSWISSSARRGIGCNTLDQIDELVSFSALTRREQSQTVMRSAGSMPQIRGLTIPPTPLPPIEGGLGWRDCDNSILEDVILVGRQTANVNMLRRAGESLLSWTLPATREAQGITNKANAVVVNREFNKVTKVEAADNFVSNNDASTGVRVRRRIEADPNFIHRETAGLGISERSRMMALHQMTEAGLQADTNLTATRNRWQVLGAIEGPRAQLQYIYQPYSDSEYIEAGWTWHTGELSKLNPWYDDYKQYSFNDIRLQGQNYGLVPEFRISEHMDFYINQNGGNFRTKNTKFLTLTGASFDEKTQVNSEDLEQTKERKHTHNSGVTFIEEEQSFYYPFEGESVTENKLILLPSYWQTNEYDSVLENKYVGNNYATSNPVANRPVYFVDIDKSEIANQLKEPWYTDVAGSSASGEIIYPESFPDAVLAFQRNEEDATFFHNTNFNPIQKNTDTVNVHISELGFKPASAAQQSVVLHGDLAMGYTPESDTDRKTPVPFAISLWLNPDVEGEEYGIFNLGAVGPAYNASSGQLVIAEAEELHQMGLAVVKNGAGIPTLTYFDTFDRGDLDDPNYDAATEIKTNFAGGGTSNVDDAGSVPIKPVFFSGCSCKIENVKNIFQFYSAVDNNNDNNEPVVLPKGEWSHVVFQYIPPTGTTFAYVRVFVNGVPKLVRHYDDVDTSDIAPADSDWHGYMAKIGSFVEISVFPDPPQYHIYGASHYEQFALLKQLTIGSATMKSLSNTTNKTLPFYGYINEVSLFTGILSKNNVNGIYNDGTPNNLVDLFKTTFSRSQPDGSLTAAPGQYSSVLAWRYDFANSISGVVTEENLSFKSDMIPSGHPVASTYASYSGTQDKTELILDTGGLPTGVDTADDPIHNQWLDGSYFGMIGWWRMGIPYVDEVVGELKSWNEDFFKVYSHTDFIKHFDLVIQDHKRLHRLTGNVPPKLSLKVNVLKKLLPYNGFYPMTRTIQLGGLFVDCWGKKISGGCSMFHAQAVQALIQPFFAPGILFNSIKSGIAVDWAAFNNRSGEEVCQAQPLPTATIELVSTGQLIPDLWRVDRGPPNTLDEDDEFWNQCETPISSPNWIENRLLGSSGYPDQEQDWTQYWGDGWIEHLQYQYYPFGLILNDDDNLPIEFQFHTETSKAQTNCAVMSNFKPYYPYDPAGAESSPPVEVLSLDVGGSPGRWVRDWTRHNPLLDEIFRAGDFSTQPVMGYRQRAPQVLGAYNFWDPSPILGGHSPYDGADPNKSGFQFDGISLSGWGSYPIVLAYPHGTNPSVESGDGSVEGWNHLRRWLGSTTEAKTDGETATSSEIGTLVLDGLLPIPGFWVNKLSEKIYAFNQTSPGGDYIVTEVPNPWHSSVEVIDIDNDWQWDIRPNLYEIIGNNAPKAWQEGYVYSEISPEAIGRTIFVDIENSSGSTKTEFQILESLAAKINELQSDGELNFIASAERLTTGGAICRVEKVGSEQTMSLINIRSRSRIPGDEAFNIKAAVGGKYTPSFYDWDKQPKNSFETQSPLTPPIFDPVLEEIGGGRLSSGTQLTSNASGLSKAGFVITRDPDMRIPFEGLLNPESVFPPSLTIEATREAQETVENAETRLSLVSPQLVCGNVIILTDPHGNEQRITIGHKAGVENFVANRGPASALGEPGSDSTLWSYPIFYRDAISNTDNVFSPSLLPWEDSDIVFDFANTDSPVSTIQILNVVKAYINRMLMSYDVEGVSDPTSLWECHILSGGHKDSHPKYFLNLNASGDHIEPYEDFRDKVPESELYETKAPCLAERYYLRIIYKGNESDKCKVKIISEGTNLNWWHESLTDSNIALSEDHRVGFSGISFGGEFLHAQMINGNWIMEPEAQGSNSFYGGEEKIFPPIENDPTRGKPSQIYFLAPEYYTGSLDEWKGWAKYPYFEWTGEAVTPLYSMAMHNFLAEVPSFFLKNKRFTSFASKPDGEFDVMEEGKTYYMDVVLQQTEGVNDGFAMTLSPNDGPTRCDHDISLGSEASTLTTNGRYYGPSFMYKDTQDYTSVGQMIADPAQAPYVPPYFYGRAVARLSFTATENRQYKVDEILGGIKVLYFNDEAKELFREVGGLQSPAFSSMMAVSASVNLLGKTKDKIISYNVVGDSINPITATDAEGSNLNRWVISSKFESPVLNFKDGENIGSLECSVEDGSPDAAMGDRTVGRGTGMWAGYGSTPKVDEGIFLSLQDSPGSALPLGGSLAKVCGFVESEKSRSRIGELADEKEVSEALVMIPFLDQPNSSGASTIVVGASHRNFFKISKKLYILTKKNIDEGKPAIKVEDGYDFLNNVQETSVSRMIKLMKKYNIPPEFDFVTYPPATGQFPFVMYIHEFHHTLDKEDLSNIWQGVMPKIARVAEKDSSVISHDLGPVDFFEGKPLPPGIRWLVFKVKQKAEINYWKKTADSKDDGRFNFNFDVGEKAPEYSYNWPYDFFSLVELVQIEGGTHISAGDLISLDAGEFETNVATGADGASVTPNPVIGPGAAAAAGVPPTVGSSLDFTDVGAINSGQDNN